MGILKYAVFVLALSAILGNAFAYYNVTSVNTTVILNKSTTARVIETFSLYISNSSMSQYVASRGAYNFTLGGWQKILQSSLLTQHILNPRASASNYTFLPGALVRTGSGGYAVLIMGYVVPNVTSVKEIAPRKFEYSFNDSVFNFNHAASGQELSPDTRLNILVPNDSQIVSIYPLPDSPAPNFVGRYTNVTTFSWFSQEPLSEFSLSYILTESPQSEVINYFTNMYASYSTLIYALIVIFVCLFVAYVYFKFIAA